MIDIDDRDLTITVGGVIILALLLTVVLSEVSMSEVSDIIKYIVVAMFAISGTKSKP